MLNQNPLARAHRLNLVPQRSGGQQNKGKDANCIATGLIGSTASLTGSSSFLQNKSKPKMVMPKNPEIGVWKTIESKGRHKHQKEKPMSFLGEFLAKSKKQIMMLVGQNIQNTQDLLQDINSMIGIGNGIIFLIQCRFRHMGHLYLCHADLVIACLIFIRHGIIIHVCCLFQDICV